jgi:hypothetical protein
MSAASFCVHTRHSQFRVHSLNDTHLGCGALGLDDDAFPWNGSNICTTTRLQTVSGEIIRWNLVLQQVFALNCRLLNTRLPSG